MLLGGLLLWGLIALLILPGESRTARILAEANLEVERVRRETGRYPPPSAGALAAHVITSRGYDGRPGRDALCVGGATRGARWLDRGARLLGGGQQEALARIRMLKCPASSP